MDTQINQWHQLVNKVREILSDSNQLTKDMPTTNALQLQSFVYELVNAKNQSAESDAESYWKLLSSYIESAERYRKLLSSYIESAERYRILFKTFENYLPDQSKKAQNLAEDIKNNIELLESLIGAIRQLEGVQLSKTSRLNSSYSFLSQHPSSLTQEVTDTPVGTSTPILSRSMSKEYNAHVAQEKNSSDTILFNRLRSDQRGNI